MRCHLLVLLLVACAEARRRKNPPKYEYHPHTGHSQAAGEHYPGHTHNKQHPLLAPKHSHHKLLTFSMHCDEDKIRELLWKGVPVDFPHEDSGDTALMFAAMDHSYANGTAAGCVKILLSWGADIERTDYDGLTPLMMASRKKNPEIVKILLDAGAEVSHSVQMGSERDKTAIDFAERSQCDECKTLLLEEPSPARQAALAKMRSRAEGHLRAAVRTYSWYWPTAWVAWWHGYPSGDECYLHRALDVARGTPGTDKDLITSAQALRSPLNEQVLDLLERRHVCDHVATYLLQHELYTLAALGSLHLSVLNYKTGLTPFEAHMLEMALKNEIQRHRRETRDRAYFKKKAEEEAEKAAESEKEELRRLSEYEKKKADTDGCTLTEPCGQEASGKQ